MAEPTTPRVTITSDEDVEVGFLLADDHTRAMTPDERVAAFVEEAVVEWGIRYDPADLDPPDRPRPFVVDEEYARPASEGEEPDEWWFVIPDLPYGVYEQ